MTMVTKETRRLLANYIRTLADMLGLRDWTFVIAWATPALEENTASINLVTNRKVGVIHIGKAFWDHTKHDQRNTMIHELLHAHMENADAVIADCQSQLGDILWSVMNDAHHRALEQAVDAIATAIDTHFPLPPRLRTEKFEPIE